MPRWHHPVFASRHILDHKNAKTFCVDPITRFGGVFPDYMHAGPRAHEVKAIRSTHDKKC